MLTIYLWNSSQNCGQWLTPESLASNWEVNKDPSDIWWIDLNYPSADEEKLVFESILHVHTLTLEDITKLRREPNSLPHFPKVEEFPDYLFVIANPLISIDGATDLDALRRGPIFHQLSAVVTHNVLITHHYQDLSSTTQLRQYLDSRGHQAERGPDYLFHLILDTMVDEYAPNLDRLTDRLDSIEQEVFGKPTPGLVNQMLQLKRIIIGMRKTLVLEREVLHRLTRGEFELIDDRESVYYRNVYDHLNRYAELVESSREMVSDLMQSHLAAVSNRMNEIMKALTMISTVVLPMTLIAGIYGMNFAVLPEKDWNYGYPFALVLMLLTGIGSFAFFRWRKWF
jgi:magnesium transporter